MFSLLSSVGCPYAATFREGSLERIDDWPPTRVSGRLLLALDLEGVDPESTAYLETKSTYADCELFSVVPPGEAADVLAKVAISQKRESDHSGAVIDIFFGLIPVHQSTKIYESTTEFRFKDRETITITASEQSDTWTHLLLIPLFPFVNPWSVERRLLRDMSRETILAAHEAGAFSD